MHKERQKTPFWATCFFCTALSIVGCKETLTEADLPQESELCQNTFEPHRAPSAGTSSHGGHGGHGGHDGHPATETQEKLGLPELLSETGLYTDIQSKKVHEAMLEYKPRFQLWSDGAEKQRWVYLPECGSIDTSDINDWKLPVGARLFKEFSLDNKRLETRLVERVGTGPYDFLFASYLWNEGETEAIKVSEEGLENVHGTQHDIPSEANCRRCHGSHSKGGGLPSRALGFSALQLAHENTPLTLDMLVERNQLTHTPIKMPSIPGDTLTQNALGYLHANCGNCHNPSKDNIAHLNLNLWLETNHATLEETGAYKTAVGIDNEVFNDQHVEKRIVKGKPNTSSVFYRMHQRGNRGQMPPIGSEIMDVDGANLVKTWIEELQE